jgi:hypothetical protein
MVSANVSNLGWVFAGVLCGFSIVNVLADNLRDRSLRLALEADVRMSAASSVDNAPMAAASITRKRARHDGSFQRLLMRIATCIRSKICLHHVFQKRLSRPTQITFRDSRRHRSSLRSHLLLHLRWLRQRRQRLH